MRHDRIPMAVKQERDAACQPCEPAGGYVNRMQSRERRSVNHGDAGPSAHQQSIDWLTSHDFGNHDGSPGDDPLSSLLHMEQEGQGNNSDFGNFGDDLFSIPHGAANPSGIFSSSHRDGDDGFGGVHGHDGNDDLPHEEHVTNSSGNSGTSDCTGAQLAGSDRASNDKQQSVEMETTLTRPFATSALRQAQLQRYRAKRLARHLGHKKIRYECRKTLADNRPRIKGRFAKVLPTGMSAAASCPDLPSLAGSLPNKRVKTEEDTTPLDSGESTGGIVPRGRRSRLSGGSDANSGAKRGAKIAMVKKEKGRRDSDGSEQMAETDDGLGHLRSSTRGALPYTQSEVSLAQLDREWIR